jgi:ankyrin repeat protein
VVELLLKCGAGVEALNKGKKTAEDVASENGNTKVARLIAEYKADANVRNETRSTTLNISQHGANEDGKGEGRGLLHAAAEEGNINVVKSLLERGIDINGRNEADQTSLNRAARKGNLDIVRLLVERGAEVDSRDMWGWTPLHLASQYGHLEVSRVLVNHGANVNARKQDHCTPLDLSARNGHLGIVKLLLERGADVLAVNDEGQTPYQLSLQRGFREIADILREHGAGRARFEEILSQCSSIAMSDWHFDFFSPY